MHEVPRCTGEEAIDFISGQTNGITIHRDFNCSKPVTFYTTPLTRQKVIEKIGDGALARSVFTNQDQAVVVYRDINGPSIMQSLNTEVGNRGGHSPRWYRKLQKLRKQRR